MFLLVVAVVLAAVAVEQVDGLLGLNSEVRYLKRLLYFYFIENSNTLQGQ